MLKAILIAVGLIALCIAIGCLIASNLGVTPGTHAHAAIVFGTTAPGAVLASRISRRERWTSPK